MINIKKLLEESRENDLKKMKDHRKKLMYLLFTRDFRTLRTELQSLHSSHFPVENEN